MDSRFLHKWVLEVRKSARFKPSLQNLGLDKTLNFVEDGLERSCAKKTAKLCCVNWSYWVRLLPKCLRQLPTFTMRPRMLLNAKIITFVTRCRACLHTYRHFSGWPYLGWQMPFQVLWNIKEYRWSSVACS